MSLRKKILYKYFPHRLFKQITFSQSGEDLLLLKCIELLELSSPKYMDVGAHHPFYFSNTALLYKMGMRGINIEPEPSLFLQIKKFRPDDVNLNIGVSTEQGQLTFFAFDTPTLNTFSVEEKNNYLKQGYKLLWERNLNVQTIDSIVNEHCAGKFPEILCIDVEGLDHAIINALDLRSNYPKIICAETVKFSQKLAINNKDTELIELLKQKGYTVFADTFINTILFKK